MKTMRIVYYVLVVCFEKVRDGNLTLWSYVVMDSCYLSEVSPLFECFYSHGQRVTPKKEIIS